MFNASYGILIPTRNMSGEIVGIQTRTDSGSLRYLTLSSKGLPMGVSENICRVHFPLSNSNCQLGPEAMVRLTEGPLKADVAVELEGQNTFYIAIPGVGNRSQLPGVFKMLKENGVERIHNAFDIDKVMNPYVAAASKKIKEIAKEAGLKYSMKLWDEDYAHQRLDQLLALCDYHGIDATKYANDNVFTYLGKVASALRSKKVDIDHVLTESGWERSYWRSETKGIDDWYKYLRSKTA